jgi:hypothetical protein
MTRAPEQGAFSSQRLCGNESEITVTAQAAKDPKDPKDPLGSPTLRRLR